MKFWLWAGPALGKWANLVYFLLCWIDPMANFLKPSWHELPSSCYWVWNIHMEALNLMNWNFSLVTDTRWVIEQDMIGKYVSHSFYNSDIQSVDSFPPVRRLDFIVWWHSSLTTEICSGPAFPVGGLIIKLQLTYNVPSCISPSPHLLGHVIFRCGSEFKKIENLRFSYKFFQLHNKEATMAGCLP